MYRNEFKGGADPYFALTEVRYVAFPQIVSRNSPVTRGGFEHPETFKLSIHTTTSQIAFQPITYTSSANEEY